MSEQRQFSYDEMPYVDAVFAQTHPDRLATVARLFGIRTPDVATCRVLELGCASGANLIPMGFGIPDARFVGIDLSVRQIQAGQEMVSMLKLPNVELHHRSITDIGEADGKFDYILCHGVYSWVPVPVREKILAICRDNLSPQGVAYVSYNTLPGWHMMGMVRDMMIFHASQFQDAVTKVRQSRALLDFLATSVLPQSPYGMTLRQVLDVIRPEADSYLFHEYLEEVNEPVYFRDFAQAATRHQLAYLAESDFGTSVISNLPRPVAETLLRIATDMVRMEQYMDFVRNRSFRQSLLIHEGIAIKRNIEPEVLNDLYVASAGRYLAQRPSFKQGASEGFRVPNGPSATPFNAITKHALHRLSEEWPLSVRFDELCDEALGKMGNDAAQASGAEHRTVLGKELLQLYASGVTDLSTLPAQLSNRPSERPVASPVARIQADRTDRVGNLRHKSVRLDAFLRSLLRLLDGTRDRVAILEALSLQSALRRPEAKVEAGSNGRNSDELPVTNGRAEKVLAKAMDEGLELLAKSALLLA